MGGLEIDMSSEADAAHRRELVDDDHRLGPPDGRHHGV
jgi:hypothetical protein